MKYVTPFISGLFGAILFTLVYNHFYAQSIGVVRMNDLIGSHIDKQGIKSMSKQEAEEKAKRFGLALDASIKEVSDEYKVLLLVSPAVVSSGADYTDIIKQRVNDKLNSDV